MARKQDWHKEDIKAAIRKRGVTLEDLALANGYARSTVRATLIQPSPNVQALIAEFLGVTPQEIWPSRYEADGTPRRSNRRKSRPRIVRRHCQIGVDA